VRDRLNQGPFPQYPPEEVVPGSDVVMATTPSADVVPGYGMGLITYLTGDMGAAEIKAAPLEKAIDDLARLPLGQKLYLRPTWRELQKQPGRLDFPEYWRIAFDCARRYGKRVGLRVTLSNPDVAEPALPDFVIERVPMVKLVGEWKGDARQVRHQKAHAEPRYDHPFFQASFGELNALLAAELNGQPLVEFVDTFMYGFWGEGHTWPYTNNPFPDYPSAEATWVRMFETQLEHWTRTPLATNTQPDFSRVGNSELVDRTIRSHNWLRTDTIFIENEQIEAIANRPPWIAAVVEAPLAGGAPEAVAVAEGVSLTDQVATHVIDVGASYWSLWNFHEISAANLSRHYAHLPEPIDRIARRVGYRVRPSMIWSYSSATEAGLILGLANDGVAGVPGVLRLEVAGPDGRSLAAGGLDPGYPLPGKVRQARLPLPRGTDWQGLRLKAELEVKGLRYPVRWACRQALNDDGSLTLRPTAGVHSD